MYTTPPIILQEINLSALKYIRLDKLIPPEFDARLSTDQISDDDLKDSIRELGVLLPLIVKNVENGIEIIAGNRRYKQAIRAGLAAVPCIVIETNGAETDKIQLHENIKRLPLSHVDQAYTFAHLIKKYKMTEGQVATLVGKSIGYVSQHLSLLQCDDILIQAVQERRINFSVARELMRCKDQDEAIRLQEQIERAGASTEIVKSWVDESNRETDNLPSPPPGSLVNSPPESPQIPMYPCGICHNPINVPEIKILRLCPDCHFSLLSEISKSRSGLAPETPT